MRINKLRIIIYFMRCVSWEIFKKPNNVVESTIPNYKVCLMFHVFDDLRFAPFPFLFKIPLIFWLTYLSSQITLLSCFNVCQLLAFINFMHSFIKTDWMENFKTSLSFWVIPNNTVKFSQRKLEFRSSK